LDVETKLNTDLEQAVQDLRLLYNYVFRMEENSPPMPDLGHDEVIERALKKIEEKLSTLLQFPPDHNRHASVFKKGFFEKTSTYENSVFIMTKFPNKNDPNDSDIRLGYVIRQVARRLEANGYRARISSEERPSYHPFLWDHVEAYLFCCRHGLAIAEDKCKAEFNPNVTMEWGWMRAMKKHVLFLVENDFSHIRADAIGALYEDFFWDNPLPGIIAAVDKHFPKIEEASLATR
jgi:hypothetical protein